MSLREKLSGTIAPLFTPFTDSGDVDHESLRRMVRWQHANGSTGISIGGSVPTFPTVSARKISPAKVFGRQSRVRTRCRKSK